MFSWFKKSKAKKPRPKEEYKEEVIPSARKEGQIIIERVKNLEVDLLRKNYPINKIKVNCPYSRNLYKFVDGKVVLKKLVERDEGPPKPEFQVPEEKIQGVLVELPQPEGDVPSQLQNPGDYPSPSLHHHPSKSPLPSPTQVQKQEEHFEDPEHSRFKPRQAGTAKNIEEGSMRRQIMEMGSEHEQPAENASGKVRFKNQDDIEIVIDNHTEMKQPERLGPKKKKNLNKK